VTIVSCDEKPGIRAIATNGAGFAARTRHPRHLCADHTYKRHGPLNLLAGIELLTGKIHEFVRDRHHAREFIEFVKPLDADYPPRTAIKLILLDNPHISRETRAWLVTRSAERFQFTLTPKHGSCLNLIEGFFPSFTRSILRHIRGAPQARAQGAHQLGYDHVNHHPVIHTWSHKLAEALDMIQTKETPVWQRPRSHIRDETNAACRGHGHKPMANEKPLAGHGQRFRRYSEDVSELLLLLPFLGTNPIRSYAERAR
jgi:transposase